MAKFRAEEKIEAVQKYLNGKDSLRTVAAEIGISHRYLLTRVKQYEHNGVEAFVKPCTNYTKQFISTSTGYKHNSSVGGDD